MTYIEQQQGQSAEFAENLGEKQDGARSLANTEPRANETIAGVKITDSFGRSASQLQ